MRILVIDIETGGLDPHAQDIIELAILIDDLQELPPLETQPILHMFIDHGRPWRMSEYAREMHRTLLNQVETPDLAALHVPVTQVMQRVVDFLDSHDMLPGTPRAPTKLVVCGKNYAGFDRRFLELQIPGWLELPISHRVLDPAILWFDPTRDTQVPAMATCLRRAGRPSRVTHIATQDAFDVAYLLRLGLERLPR